MIYRRGSSGVIKAAQIADKALAEVLDLLSPGVKEITVARELLQSIKKHGGGGFSFRPIVASGIRSAMPHGRASSKRMRNGDIVVVDFGVRYRGFCSDITRTFVIGRPSLKQARIFGILRASQEKAIKAVRAGVACSAIDLKARGYLKKKGLDKYFIHSTGHGIGRKVHEAPNISRKNGNILRTGDIITIEPGVYMKGWGGMRIEDMVLVSGSGCRLLTRFPRGIKIR